MIGVIFEGGLPFDNCNYSLNSLTSVHDRLVRLLSPRLVAELLIHQLDNTESDSSGPGVGVIFTYHGRDANFSPEAQDHPIESLDIVDITMRRLCCSVACIPMIPNLCQESEHNR